MTLATLLKQHPRIDGYMGVETEPRDYAFNSVKQDFKRLGKAFLRKVAKSMPLKEFKVDYNPAGPACSGDLSLMGMFDDTHGFHLFFNADGGCPGMCYRSIKNMKDYTGDRNRWIGLSFVGEPEKVAEIIKTTL